MKNEIIVYRNRTNAIFPIVSLSITLFFFIVAVAFMSWLSESLFLFNFSDITGELCILFFLFNTCRAILHLFTRQLFASDSILVANSQGIYVGKLPGVIGEAFISWREIELISMNSSFFSTSLCIFPKNRRNYLSGFSLWKRLNMGIFSWPGALKIIQYWMASPIDEFLQQVRLQYAHELEENGIQLRD